MIVQSCAGRGDSLRALVYGASDIAPRGWRVLDNL
jgi:hypothetical protein